MNDAYNGVQKFIYDDAVGALGAGVVVQPMAGVMQSGFTIQYGIGANVWVAAGSSITNMNGVTISDTVGTPDNYTWTTCEGGIVTRFWYNSATGYSSQVVSRDDVQHILVVQRSTDLKNWTDVCTNQFCMRGEIEMWTDTAAPDLKAFYRVRQDQ